MICVGVSDAGCFVVHFRPPFLGECVGTDVFNEGSGLVDEVLAREERDP